MWLFPCNHLFFGSLCSIIQSNAPFYFTCWFRGLFSSCLFFNLWWMISTEQHRGGDINLIISIIPTVAFCNVKLKTKIPVFEWNSSGNWKYMMVTLFMLLPGLVFLLFVYGKVSDQREWKLLLRISRKHYKFSTFSTFYL